jgi:hypothetical protein
VFVDALVGRTLWPNYPSELCGDNHLRVSNAGFSFN